VILKKQIAFCLLTFTYVLLLGHSIIPHHSHEYEDELVAHHQTHHHHDDDAEAENDISHFFSHFLHSSDGFILTASYNFTNAVYKQLTVVVLPDNFSLDEFDIPPLLIIPPAELHIYISPHSHTAGLRAPPAFIA